VLQIQLAVQIDCGDNVPETLNNRLVRTTLKKLCRKAEQSPIDPFKLNQEKSITEQQQLNGQNNKYGTVVRFGASSTNLGSP